MAKAEIPELVAAAQIIEEEQRKLESLASSLQRTKLQTEKTISRAARELQEALDQQQQLAKSLQLLGLAMVRMQERQQAAVTVLSARAEDIQARRTRLSELMMRYASLGTKAAELLQVLSESIETADRKAAVQSAQAHLATIVEEATTLAKIGRDEDFTELAHEADVLKQKFNAIKNQLGGKANGA